MAKQKQTAEKGKRKTIPTAFLDQLLSMPDGEARSVGMTGISTVMGITVEALQTLVDERAETREHEELLNDLDFDADSVTGKLPESVTDILEGDSTKRFVLTLRYDGEDGYVLTPSIQTARGRKAKDSD